MKPIADLQVNDVLAVYSGKDGSCCCGCSGKHTYNPDWKALAGENRGYEVDDEECSLRTVKLILNKFKKATHVNVDDDNQYSFSTVGGHKWSRRLRRPLPTPGRLYILSLVPSFEEREKLRHDRMKRKEEQAAREAKARADVLEALKGAGI